MTAGASAFDVLAGLALEDGRPWAEAATDVQLADARAVLEGEEPYHFLTRSRGYSKTADMAGGALGVLVTVEADARLYWLAADADQGRLALDSIGGFVRRTSALAGEVEVQTSRVVARSGATLTVLPADAAGSWGLRPDWGFADELSQWPVTTSSTRLWEGLTSAMTKRPGARLVVITTAGAPSHFAHKVLEHARGSKLWRASETPGPPPWADAERLSEQRTRLPAAVYDQLHENRWVEATGNFLDPAMLDAAFTLDGPALEREDGRSYVAALDLGAVHDRTVLALGHRDGQRTRLDLMTTWQGRKGAPVSFEDVGLTIRELHERFRFELRVDPWQAMEMVERLRRSRVSVSEYHFSAQSKMRLASTLLHSLNTGSLELYPAEGLRDELGQLRVKQTGGGLFAFDHASGEHDDRAVALALMALAAIEDTPRGGGSIALGPTFTEPVVQRGEIRLVGERYLDRDSPEWRKHFGSRR